MMGGWPAPLLSDWKEFTCGDRRCAPQSSAGLAFFASSMLKTKDPGEKIIKSFFFVPSWHSNLMGRLQ